MNHKIGGGDHEKANVVFNNRGIGFLPNSQRNFKIGGCGTEEAGFRQLAASYESGFKRP
jgi:hypothetical protein